MFKFITSMKVTPCFKPAPRIKLFGTHIYSPSMLMWDEFVFKLEFKFDIPINPTLSSSTLPMNLNHL